MSERLIELINKKREFDEIVDLHIEVCGVSSDLKTLALKVKEGNREWKKTISITSADLFWLLQFKRRQRMMNYLKQNNEEMPKVPNQAN